MPTCKTMAHPHHQGCHQQKHSDTLLLDHPHGHDSINAMYQVETMTVTHDHIQCMGHHTSKEHIHNVYELPSIEQSIQYLHGAAGFPTKPSWLKAICRGNYNSWPLINVKNVAKYFPESEEMQKGHKQGQHQGVQSTKKTESTLAKDDKDLDAPPHNSKRDVLITVYNLRNMMYTDQTGKFPYISSLGNQYIMILHNVDSNLLWAEAIQNNTEGELILAQQRALARMKRCGIVPTHQILDNQASAAYKTAIETSKMTYQLVPPDNHQRNMAKKSHSNIQEPLCQHPKQMCPHHADAFMVPTTPPSRTPTTTTTTILSQPQHVCICAPLRTA
jgi:hypothetical protein